MNEGLCILIALLVIMLVLYCLLFKILRLSKNICFPECNNLFISCYLYNILTAGNRTLKYLHLFALTYTLYKFVNQWYNFFISAISIRIRNLVGVLEAPSTFMSMFKRLLCGFKQCLHLKVLSNLRSHI